MIHQSWDKFFEAEAAKMDTECEGHAQKFGVVDPTVWMAEHGMKGCEGMPCREGCPFTDGSIFDGVKSRATLAGFPS